MKMDFDAIAIGGGLAGSAFAITLARQGLRVAVIERTPAPQIKVCGDFLSAEAQQLLLGLGLDVRAMGAHRITDFRLATQRIAATAPLPFDAAGLSRLKLDESLLNEARRAGAEIIRGKGASALEPGPRHVTIQIGGRALTAQWVALATGKHNFRGLQRPGGGPTAFKMSFELSASAVRSLLGVVQLVSYRGGYIGACNIECGAATLCWLADKSFMQRTQGRWSTQLDELARKSPYLCDLLVNAKPLAEKPATISAIPIGYIRHNEIEARVFPIGDQIAVIPSFTGDGTSIALLSGIAAAQAVVTGQRAGQFQDAFHARLRGQFRWARAIDLSFRSPLARFLSVGAVAAFPGLATGLTRLTRLSNAPSDTMRA